LLPTALSVVNLKSLVMICCCLCCCSNVGCCCKHNVVASSWLWSDWHKFSVSSVALSCSQLPQ